MSKTMLTPEAIESQAVLALPERKLPLVTVVITNLLNNLSVSIPVQNNKIAVEVCAAVQAITLLTGAALDCDINQ